MGVDGATFDIIKPLVRDGELPNFAKLMDRGSFCTLKSTVPLLSPAAWTTFSTGVRPGKHGIFNFLARKNGTYEIDPASSELRRVKPVWKVAGEAGRKVVVMNVPATFPPDAVNGIMIAGDPTPFHDERRLFPSGSYRGLEQHFGKGFLKPAPPFRGESSFLDTLLHSVELWTNIAKFTMEQEDWDLATVVYTATDTAQHFFWRTFDKAHPLYSHKSAERYGNAILAVYKKIDWALGELVKLADEHTHIVVLSDHGFGPLYQAVPLTGWLVEKGYLTYLSGPKGKGYRGLADTVKFVLSRLRLAEGLPPLSILRDVDWTKTKAYFLGVSGDIFVNLKGREPQGIVAPGREYDELIEKMSRELESLRLADGSAPVEAVLRGKDLYPDSAGSPDLFVKWAKGFDIVKEGEPDSIVRALRKRSVNAWSGTHMEEGILILAGEAIERAALRGASIEDVAPTIYHLLGLPVPALLEGKVLADAIRSDRLKAPEMCNLDIMEKGFSETIFSDEDARRVEESLRNLGYLE